MGKATSLVAKEFRLKEWAAQIRDCQNRPKGVTVPEWCKLNNIHKDAYYCRLKRARKECITRAERQS